MATDKIRKYVLPNIPYLFIGWFCLKIGTAYRLAAGAGFGEKLLGLGQTIGAAFASFAPGLAPLDWFVGIVGAAGFLLLQDIAAVGGDDIGPGCPDHGKVLHDHLAADSKLRGQVLGGNGGIGLVKQGQDFFPALCGRHTGAPFPIRLSSSASFMAFATSFRMGSVNSIAPAAHRCKRMAKIPDKRLGFLGLLGFWVYPQTEEVFPLHSFCSLAFSGSFWRAECPTR